MAGSNNNPSTGLEIHDDYPGLMEGMHRNPPGQIGAPAITQHLAFWIPDDYVESGNRGGWGKAVEEFVDRLDNHLIKLGFKSKEEQPIKLRKNPQYPDRYPIARFAFRWQSMPTELDVELEDEYFTISATIDLSQLKKPLRKKLDPIAKIFIDAIETFNAVCLKRYQEVRASGVTIDRHRDRGKLKNSYENVYHNIWDSFNSTILTDPLGADVRNNLGGVFAIFRNLLVNRPGTDPKLNPDSGSKSTERFIDPPGLVPKDRPPILEHRPFGRKELLDCIEAVMPWVTNAQEMAETQDKQPEPIEYTISTFLNRRVFHASGLGAHALALREDKRPHVHMDLVVATHSDRWQLGRLIGRGNVLGALRLAALYDSWRLGEAVGKLYDLENDLEEISEDLQKVPDFEDRGARIKTIADKLLNHAKDLTDRGNEIRGGLEHRVERSSRYRREFLDYLKALRLSRVEGSQPYDEFVLRRLNDTYASIDEAGDLFKKLQETITRHSRQISVTELGEVQRELSGHVKTIAGLQTTIASLDTQIAKQTEAAAGYQKFLAVAQKFGEPIVLVAVFPAAVGDIAAKILSEDSKIVPWITGASVVAGIAAAAREVLPRQLRRIKIGPYRKLEARRARRRRLETPYIGL